MYATAVYLPDCSLLVKPVLLMELMDLDERAVALSAFRSGEANTLVCSEMLSRGIDVPSVTHVIQVHSHPKHTTLSGSMTRHKLAATDDTPSLQFNLPTRAENYLHRAGRTGRLGRKGRVISLIDKTEDFVVKRYENELGIVVRRRVLTPKTNHVKG